MSSTELSLLGQVACSVAAAPLRPCLRSARGRPALAAQHAMGASRRLARCCCPPCQARLACLQLHQLCQSEDHGGGWLFRFPAEVRGETQVQDTLSLGGSASVGEELATGLLNGPLGGGSGGVAAMLAECSPAADAGAPRKKPKITPLPCKGRLQACDCLRLCWPVLAARVVSASCVLVW